MRLAKEILHENFICDHVVNFCQHPLALLFLGGSLTYIIAPMIVNGINERKLIQETKQTRALEIWNHDTQFSSRIKCTEDNAGVLS